MAVQRNPNLYRGGLVGLLNLYNDHLTNNRRKRLIPIVGLSQSRIPCRSIVQSPDGQMWRVRDGAVKEWLQYPRIQTVMEPDNPIIAHLHIQKQIRIVRPREPLQRQREWLDAPKRCAHVIAQVVRGDVTGKREYQGYVGRNYAGEGIIFRSQDINRPVVGKCGE